MSLPRYPEYIDSGERWLGAIPAHWRVHRLKNLFQIRKRIVGEDGHQVLSITQRGIKIKDIESNDGQLSMDYSKYQVVNPGDFAMNHMDLLTGFVDISAHAGITSPDYRVFVIRDEVVCEPKYFLHLLQNGYRQRIFYAFGQGASEFGRWRFPTDQFNDFRFPCPPHDEQVAIVTFLDRETAKIDALIAEQEKLVALLVEKRQATISQAVTKGLNLDVPMKDSGVAWLGKVPEHWDVWKLAHAFGSIGSGTTPPSDESVWYSNGTVPWVTTSELRESIIYETAKMVTEAATRRFSSLRLHPAGALAIAMYGATIGRLGIFGIDATTNQACCVLSQPRALDVRFVFYWLQGFKQSLIDFFATGGGQPNINQEIIASLRIPAPALSEQAEIARHLDAETTILDKLKSEAENAVILLNERRCTLIAAAITGQIDVRNKMASLAEQLEELAA